MAATKEKLSKKQMKRKPKTVKGDIVRGPVTAKNRGDIIPFQPFDLNIEFNSHIEVTRFLAFLEDNDLDEDDTILCDLIDDIVCVLGKKI